MYKIAFDLAWKSLIRRKTRTLMVIVMIALSLSGLLFLQGLYDGMVSHMINTTIRSDSGEISLYAKQYRLEKNIDYHIDDPRSIKTYLDGFNEIDAYAIRLSGEGLVSTAHKSLGATLKGVRLEDERRFGDFDTFLSQGKFDFGPKNQEALIGFKLAQKLKVTIGSRLVFTAQDASGEINAISFRISGIVKSGNLAVDEGSVFVSIETMEQFLALPNSATQIALRIKDESHINSIQSKIQKKFNSLDVLRWDELYPLLVEMRDMMDIFNWLSYAIVFAVAALGIFGVILMSILERMREFSIMMAIGTPYKSIRYQVISEAFIMAIIGYIIGALLGLGFLAYTASSGIDLRYYQAGLESFGLNAILYADIRYYYFLQAFGAVFFATFLSVLWPLHVLKKIKPIEIIQGKML
ncbi:MAG: FtsX-like permease family protein [Sulfurovaceae bacterium]|nr:FtsX-like permease family protein [Sulfurovaceae bacterium]